MSRERCWEWVKRDGVDARCSAVAHWKASTGSAYCDDHQLIGCVPIPTDEDRGWIRTADALPVERDHVLIGGIAADGVERGGRDVRAGAARDTRGGRAMKPPTMRVLTPAQKLGKAQAEIYRLRMVLRTIAEHEAGDGWHEPDYRGSLWYVQSLARDEVPRKAD